MGGARMGGVQAWEAAAYRGRRRPPAGGPGGRRKKTCIKKLAKIKMRRQKTMAHMWKSNQNLLA